MISRSTGARRPVVLEDLARLRWPLEPAIRPDGSEVAYIVAGLDPHLDRLVYRAHRRSLDGGDPRVVAPVGAETNERLPQWSPDGRYLARVTETRSVAEIAVVDDDRPIELPAVAGTVIDFDWAPDSRRLIVLHSALDDNVSSARVSVIDLNGASELLDLGELSTVAVGQVRWRPGTESIALVCSAASDVVASPPRHDRETSVRLFDLESRHSVCLVQWHGPVSNIAWAPDGSSLALLGHDGGPALWENSNLWIVRPDDVSGPANVSGVLDRSVGQAIRGDDERGIGRPTLGWSSDGNRVHAIVADRGRSHVVSFDLDGGISPVTSGDRAVLEFAVSSSGEGGGHDEMVVSWSDPLQPGELTHCGADGERVLTDLNRRWLAEVELCPTSLVEARDCAEDAPLVDAWVTAPALAGAESPAPLVVQIHGGPHHPVGFRFSFDAQRLAGAGMALMRSNPRGSHGHGRDFAASIRGQWGGPDLRDVLALVDETSGRATIDAERIAIVGESYGGFLVNWAIGHSNRFVAAIAENGISDVLRLAFGPSGREFWWPEFDGDPSVDPAPFLERSPARYVDAIATPLLLLHAEDDDNCPIIQSETMLQALTDRNKSVRLIRVREEGHLINVFGRLSSRLARTRAFDEFLIEHLRPGHARVGSSSVSPTMKVPPS